jgi:hypothetical protein
MLGDRVSPKRLVILVVVVAAGWGMLLLRPEPKRVPRPATAPESAAIPAPAPSATAAQARPYPHPRPSQPPVPSAVPAHAPVPTAQPAREVAAAPQAAAAQLPQDPRYLAAVASFEREQKREPWAGQRTRILRNALRADRMEPLLRSIECRSTLCRIELSTPDNEAAMALRQGIHFTKEAGVQMTGGFEGEGEARTLVLFTARPGTSL